MYTVGMKKEERHGTLYRTYRPATFDEVRGQPQVTDTLAKAIKKGDVVKTVVN